MSDTPKIPALEAELALTREQLAATVDEISGRLSPANLAEDAKDSGRKVWRDAIGSDPDADPENRTQSLVILSVVAATAATAATLVLRKIF